MKRIALCCLFFSGFVVSGCFNLEPKPDNTVIYTLGPHAHEDGRSVNEGRIVYVNRPELPSYLMGSSVVFHTDTGALTSLSHARWGEDLEDGIARAVAEYLQSTGKVNVRSQYPWPKLARDDWDVRVLFKRFGATEDGVVHVSAVWQIRDNGDVMKEGLFASEGLQCDLSDASSYVAELNAGLEQLANQIGQEL